MPQSKTVGLLFDAWDDFARVLAGLDTAAVTSAADGSSFAWTAAHTANQVDAWINVRFAGHDPHPLIGQQRFRFGGSGQAEDWDAVLSGVAEVQAAARAYLEPLSEADLERVIPYDGSITDLREKGLRLRYAVHRACAHHWFHIGEIAAKRARLEHDVGDYPGRLENAL